VATIEIEGIEYELTDAERAEYDRLIALGYNPERALEIATGDFDDLVPLRDS
jgi:hypothetical protein